MCSISTSTDAITTQSTETITEVRHKINNYFKNESITNLGVGSSNANASKNSTNIINSQLYSISSYNLFSSSSSSYTPITPSSPSLSLMCPPKKPPRMKMLSTTISTQLPSIPEIQIPPLPRRSSSRSSSSKECTSSETSPDVTSNRILVTTTAMIHDEEFINSEFYIDESLPSSFDESDAAERVIDNDDDDDFYRNDEKIYGDKLKRSLKGFATSNGDDGGDDDKDGGGGRGSSRDNNNHCDSQTVILLLQVLEFQENETKLS